MLDRPSQRMSKEFLSSIYDKDYFYLSLMYEEFRKGKLVVLSYYIHLASTVMAFWPTEKVEVFQPDHVRKEKDMLKDLVNAFTVERNLCLKEIQEVSFLFLGIL